MAAPTSIFRRKSVEDSLASTDDPERHLRRSLSAWDLAVLGVAVAVGAGIVVALIAGLSVVEVL